MNFRVRRPSGGVGVFHAKGWGSKTSFSLSGKFTPSPRNPGNRDFVPGMSRFFAGMSQTLGGVQKVRAHSSAPISLRA